MAERRLEFVRENGVMRLPPGFRFQPTDEELVFQYLKSKIFSCSLPATVIPHINICRYDPWDLPHAAAGTTPSNSNWVICRIFLKKRSMQREDADHNGVVGQPGRFHDFMMTRDNNITLSPEISSCSSFSSSSAISEVSSNEFHREESRGRNFF
ncbi:hypothetical protein LWI29_002508 [Acer saccharum]|uniref:NAC domain-containing protein n=1 Tax=Acer saccharum TaxID=4024 RepID=A0AA39VQ77_ACESA|nr:hypothetical protein LWI29_002508 [Acer saccharum]